MKEGDIFEIAYKITEEIHKGYINIFNDRNPLHTDHEFAAQKGFPEIVMHGGILTGFLSNFVGEQLPVKNVMIQSYKIFFVKPVIMNTPLILKATVTGVFPSVNSIVFKYAFQNETGVFSKGELSIGYI